MYSLYSHNKCCKRALVPPRSNLSPLSDGWTYRWNSLQQSGTDFNVLAFFYGIEGWLPLFSPVSCLFSSTSVCVTAKPLLARVKCRQPSVSSDTHSVTSCFCSSSTEERHSGNVTHETFMLSLPVQWGTHLKKLVWIARALTGPLTGFPPTVTANCAQWPLRPSQRSYC